MAALIVALVSTVYAFGLHASLMPMLSWPVLARMVIALAVMLPLATMGMPFPIGLRQLGQSHAELLPWAWAINGCASVLAGPLATLFALRAGLPAVLLAASGCYVVTALVANMGQTRLLFPNWMKGT